MVYVGRRRGAIIRGNALRRWVRSFRVRRALRGSIRNVNIRRRVARYVPTFPRAQLFASSSPAAHAALMAQVRRARRLRLWQSMARRIGPTRVMNNTRRAFAQVRRPGRVPTRTGRRRLLR